MAITRAPRGPGLAGEQFFIEAAARRQVHPKQKAKDFLVDDDAILSDEDDFESEDSLDAGDTHGYSPPNTRHRAAKRKAAEEAKSGSESSHKIRRTSVAPTDNVASLSNSTRPAINSNSPEKHLMRSPAKDPMNSPLVKPNVRFMIPSQHSTPFSPTRNIVQDVLAKSHADGPGLRSQSDTVMAIDHKGNQVELPKHSKHLNLTLMVKLNLADLPQSGYNPSPDGQSMAKPPPTTASVPTSAAIDFQVVNATAITNFNLSENPRPNPSPLQPLPLETNATVLPESSTLPTAAASTLHVSPTSIVPTSAPPVQAQGNSPPQVKISPSQPHALPPHLRPHPMPPPFPYMPYRTPRLPPRRLPGPHHIPPPMLPPGQQMALPPSRWPPHPRAPGPQTISERPATAGPVSDPSTSLATQHSPYLQSDYYQAAGYNGYHYEDYYPGSYPPYGYEAYGPTNYTYGGDMYMTAQGADESGTQHGGQ